MPRLLTKKRAVLRIAALGCTLQVNYLVLRPCFRFPLMEYTVGGKYRLEEEIANGGCGMYTLLPSSYGAAYF